jgi:DNA recombination protein RmuC
MEKTESEASHTLALQNFHRHVRDHVKALGSKEYWRHFDTPEFVVMFLPTEGLYSLAVSGDPGLIEEAARKNIILASPTTLMGLLRVVMHGWQQQKMAEEAKNVSALAADLYNRLCAFGDHMQRIGAGLGTAIGSYNKAVGSLENSVLRPARKLRDLHVQTGGKEIADMPEVAETPRTLEITDNNKDEAA